jgi:hypothetical protein
MKSRSIRFFGISGTFAVAALIGCMFTALSAPQSKPNFTGSWKMNPQKSKFGGGGPDSIQIKIDHKDPEFVESWTLATPDGEKTFQAKYTIGGKETEQEVMGRSAKTLAKWDGDTLLIEWKAGDGSFNRKITLSADGKTMTKIVTQSDGGGQQMEDTVVFDKQ